MARLWRAYHPELTDDPIGESVVLSREEAHHVLRVLRLEDGAPLAVFDGRGREWSGRLSREGTGRASVRLEREVTSTVEPPLDLVLFQGLGRSERMDWLVQKATEIGVGDIRALRCRRAEGRRPRVDRWQRIAVEACKQSGRRRVPPVGVVDGLPDAVAGGPPAVLLDPRARTGLDRRIGPEAPRTIWLAVGPESGFEPAEVDAWVDRGWRPRALGPRALRAETAGLVAATILLHAWGDLGRAAGAAV